MTQLQSQQTVTTIDLMRHGECEGGDIWRGHVDVQLSPKGWQSMRRSVASFKNAAGLKSTAGLESAVGLKDDNWDRIVSSPLLRCAEFSRELAEQRGIELALRESFKEVNFGDWDGKSTKEVWRNHKESVLEFYDNPESSAPHNGESLQQLRERLIPAWQKLLTEHQGEHILLVQHGGTIRVLLGWLLDMPMAAVLRFEIPYASISRIRVFHSDDGSQPFPSLVFLNRGCAIEAPA